MKRFFAIFLSFFCSVALTAQPLADYSDSEVLGVGRLAPRGEINPYASRDEAIAGNLSGEYIIPLGDWQTTESADAVTYSTRFKVSYRWSDRVVLLRVEDATSSYEVTINGTPVGYSQAGSGRTEFDLTKLSQENYNTIEIKVFKHSVAEVLEDGREHRGEAQFRRATIISQPKVRIRDINVTSTYSIGQSNMMIEVDMESHLLNSKEFKVYYELIAPNGDVVSHGNRTFTTDMLKGDNVIFMASLSDALPWNHETPYLYRLVVRTQYEGRFKEYTSRRVAFRDAVYADGKIALDGKVVDMVSAEASFEGDVQTTFNKLSALKESGVNCVVVTGGTQPDDFYTICDRLGLYVIDCADVDTSRGGDRKVGGNPSNDPRWTAAFVDRAERMYHFSQHHPSVVGFSPAARSGNGICLYESYLALKALEKERPIWYPASEGEWNNDPMTFVAEAQSVGGVHIEGDRIAEGFVNVVNNNHLSPLRATLRTVVKQGGAVRSEKEEPVRVAAGGSLMTTFSLADVRPQRKATVVVELLAEPMPYEYNLPGEPRKLTLKEEMFGVSDKVERAVIQSVEFEIPAQK